MSIALDDDSLFVYGSLLEGTKRVEILGHQVEVVEARLEGFERRRGRYFYIVRAADASTRGLIMLGLTAEDWAKLDAYEEVPELYTREAVEVDATGGRTRCWVYLPTVNCLDANAKI